MSIRFFFPIIFLIATLAGCQADRHRPHQTDPAAMGIAGQRPVFEAPAKKPTDNLNKTGVGTIRPGNIRYEP